MAVGSCAVEIRGPIMNVVRDDVLQREIQCAWFEGILC
ncbi:MAG: hypothetical protein FD134_1375 [Gallionellaceae bacterium]|nr:MAG: hypothetical protein FD134_1375 [Gallionellaceae bacterium]